MKKKITKKNLTSLKKIRNLWFLIDGILIITWVFSFPILWNVVSDENQNLILTLCCTGLVWFIGFPALWSIFRFINLKYCLMSRESIARCIDNYLKYDSKYTRVMIHEMKKRNINVEINDGNDSYFDDFIREIRLNGKSLFSCYRNDGIYLNEKNKRIAIESYVSYELLAYLYFEIKECTEITDKRINEEEEKRKQLKAEERNRKCKELEDSIFRDIQK
ncbi:hypothetical protein [Breznakia pachnodae]|uniref:Uncharacterized protein n=1 Tax=Breznakia pachnodae TaxID=265178 RepID=A0ABU0E928_9FIRM|nr:hypothetical protein [Breznakia pachnodae]MDQ0363231.1 hypothetical protein [Breznakia pachnodae]